MLTRVYTKVFNFAKTKPFKLWAYTWLGTIIVSFVSMLGGAVPLFGVAAGLLIQTAVLMMCIKAIRGEEFSVDNLFDCCRSWNGVLRIVGGNLWAALFIFLWGLIPIAGPVIAIIRAYEYRLVPYILAYEPDVSIKDARIISRQRTYGYKWDMFTCDVVWICGVVLAVVLFGLFARIPVIGGIFTLANVLLVGSFILFSSVVSCLINAECYEEICPPSHEEATASSAAGENESPKAEAEAEEPAKVNLEASEGAKEETSSSKEE